jgi:hypothetical protein
MNRNFWHDLYPTSETRKRLARSSLLWIYLPIAVGALLAVAVAVAVLGLAPRASPAGWAHWAELATVILAAALLVTGFIAWLAILTSIWGLRDLLGKLPDFTSRMRLRFILGTRSWKRGLNAVKHAAAVVSQAISPGPQSGRPRTAAGDGTAAERRAR